MSHWMCPVWILRDGEKSFELEGGRLLSSGDSPLGTKQQQETTVFARLAVEPTKTINKRKC